MPQQAILVKGDFILSTRAINLYKKDIIIDCNAIMMIFVKMKQEEIKDSVIYVNGCPSLNDVSMLFMAKIKKLVLKQAPINSDEMCAVEFLRQNGIPVIIKPDICFEVI